jgi:hypothetical protein
VWPTRARSPTGPPSSAGPLHARGLATEIAPAQVASERRRTPVMNAEPGHRSRVEAL